MDNTTLTFLLIHCLAFAVYAIAFVAAACTCSLTGLDVTPAAAPVSFRVLRAPVEYRLAPQDDLDAPIQLPRLLVKAYGGQTKITRDQMAACLRLVRKEIRKCAAGDAGAV